MGDSSAKRTHVVRLCAVHAAAADSDGCTERIAEPNWREHLSLDALGYPPEARLADSNKLALLEIATMGVQAWERAVHRSWLAFGVR